MSVTVELKGRITRTYSAVVKFYRVEREVISDDKPPERSRHNYSGSWHCVSLMTSRDIYLTHLEFFGPAEEEVAKYRVATWVSKDVSESTCCLCPTSFRSETLSPQSEDPELVTAEKGTKFIVALSNPCTIKANEWVNIKFTLNGPDTERMKKMRTLQRVQLDDGSKIDFNFSWGSGQLSAIIFTED